MTELYVSENQLNKIKTALSKGCDVTIRISAKNVNTTSANVSLSLTKTQINKIHKAVTQNKGIQLKISARQLKSSSIKKDGGFLPLLALLPAILGAAGGVAGGIASAVNSSKQTAEQARHNKAIEDIAKQQSGSGFISNAAEYIPIVGKPLSDALKKLGLGCGSRPLFGLKIGQGLYLEPQGSGLHLQPQGVGLYLGSQNN